GPIDSVSVAQQGHYLAVFHRPGKHPTVSVIDTRAKDLVVPIPFQESLRNVALSSSGRWLATVSRNSITTFLLRPDAAAPPKPFVSQVPLFVGEPDVPVDTLIVDSTELPGLGAQE